MVITSVLYDLISATTGAVLGAFIMLIIGWKKTKKMSNDIVIGNDELERLRIENDRLLGMIQNKEDQILAMEKKILNKKWR